MQKLSTFQAIKCGKILSAHGKRLLEVQLATGGVIDPIHNHRLPNALAIERGLINQELVDELFGQGLDSKFKMFNDPNTGENVCYQELMARCTVDEVSGLRLLPIEIAADKKSRRSRAASGTTSRNTSRLTSRTESCSSIPETAFSCGNPSEKLISQELENQKNLSKNVN